MFLIRWVRQEYWVKRKKTLEAKLKVQEEERMDTVCHRARGKAWNLENTRKNELALCLRRGHVLLGKGVKGRG